MKALKDRSREEQKAAFANMNTIQKKPSRYEKTKPKNAETLITESSKILRKHEQKIQEKKDRFDKADQMKRPKYSGIKWEKHKGLDTSPDHIVAKGTKKQLRENYGLVWGELKEDNIFHHTITGGKVKHFFGWNGSNDDSDKIRIGDTYYNKAYVYEIFEEITGEPIFYKNSYKIRKSAVGKEIRIPVKMSEKEMFPIAFEGNHGYYLIAPVVVMDEEPSGDIDKNSFTMKRKGTGRVDSDEVRDFFVQHQDKDGVVPYSKLEKRFGKKDAYGLHERGLIYEPIRGKAKMV